MAEIHLGDSELGARLGNSETLFHSRSKGVICPRADRPKYCVGSRLKHRSDRQLVATGGGESSSSVMLSVWSCLGSSGWIATPHLCVHRRLGGPG